MWWGRSKQCTSDSSYYPSYGLVFHLQKAMAGFITQQNCISRIFYIIVHCFPFVYMPLLVRFLGNNLSHKFYVHFFLYLCIHLDFEDS